MIDLLNDLKTQLCALREQGMKISDINPISALADTLSDKLYSQTLSMADIDQLLDQIASQTWHEQADRLAKQTGLSESDHTAFEATATALSKRSITRPLYRAVFTAHPVFALQKQASDALCAAAITSKAKEPDPQVAKSYEPRQTVTLQDEHEEAMQALGSNMAS